MSDTDIAASASLKHFFPMLETSGTKITDIKGGVVWDAATDGKLLVFDPANRSVGTNMASADNPILLSSGAWENISSAKQMLRLAAGEVSDAASTHVRLAIGDTNNMLGGGAGGIGMAGNPFHSAMRATGPGGLFERTRTVANPRRPISDYIEDVDPVFYDTASHAGQDHALLLTYTGGACLDSVYKAMDINTWTPVLETNFVFDSVLDSDGSGYVPVIWDSVGGLVAIAAMRFAGMKLYGYAIFVYDELPSRYEEYCEETVRRWRNGDRTIHPGLL
jgi:hypothetical protein